MSVWASTDSRWPSYLEVRSYDSWHCDSEISSAQVCIEALSVNLRQQTLDAAGRNLTKLDAVGLTRAHVHMHHAFRVPVVSTVSKVSSLLFFYISMAHLACEGVSDANHRIGYFTYVIYSSLRKSHTYPHFARVVVHQGYSPCEGG